MNASRASRLLGIVTWGACACASPRSRVALDRLDAGPVGQTAAVTGLYWARWDDVPDGVRVAVWLDADADRVRGTWDLPPWHGDIAGQRHGDVFALTWHEEGTIAVQQSRLRSASLRWDHGSGVLRGALGGDDGGTTSLELSPAGFAPPALRAGLWLGRWTGLPTGMAVETMLSRDPDGRWRAVYRYQGREGSFIGDGQPDGSLVIQWHELSTRDAVAVGQGVLRPTAFGLRGTYGVGAQSEGTGEWSLEPLAER